MSALRCRATAVTGRLRRSTTPIVSSTFVAGPRANAIAPPPGDQARSRSSPGPRLPRPAVGLREEQPAARGHGDGCARGRPRRPAARDALREPTPLLAVRRCQRQARGAGHGLGHVRDPCPARRPARPGNADPVAGGLEPPRPRAVGRDRVHARAAERVGEPAAVRRPRQAGDHVPLAPGRRRGVSRRCRRRARSSGRQPHASPRQVTPSPAPTRARAGCPPGRQSSSSPRRALRPRPQRRA